MPSSKVPSEVPGRVNISPKGTRMLIGQGWEAEIFRYLDGPFINRVGRVPRDIEHHNHANLSGNALARYRRHQIAQELFPEYCIEVTGFDFNDNEMFSVEIERSKANLRESTLPAINKRPTKEYPVDEKTMQLARQIAEAGIIVNSTFPNVSIRKDGVITFFEIESIDEIRVAKFLNGKSDKLKKRVELLLEVKRFEEELDELDLYMFYTDSAERLDVLSRNNSSKLSEYYSNAIGSEIVIPKD